MPPYKGNSLPTDPSSWIAGDYVTARRLNADLFTYDGSTFFHPTGLHFHARRPVYSAFGISNGALAPGWQTTNGPVSMTIADTSAIYGTSMDPQLTGTLVQNGPAGTGGTATSNGGFWLLWDYVQMKAGSANTYGAGLGPASGPFPSSAGTFQQGNTSNAGAAFCMDLMDVTAGDITQWIFSNGSIVGGITPLGDGSGQWPMLQGFWSSIYQPNGTTISSVPSPATSWTTATTTTLNTTIRNTLRLLNMPPALRATQSGTQGVASNTQTQITLANNPIDTYNGFSASTYTVPLTGLYLVHGLIAWDGGGTGEQATGISINNGANGTYWGPAAPRSNTGRVQTAKTQIFDLQAGDTLQLMGLQISGGSAGTGASGASRMIALFLGATGTPAVFETVPPDITFRYTAGTPGATVATQLDQTGGNLNYLLQRPYATVYSTANQTGISLNARTGLNCYNNVAGIVHGTNGDNYSGWDAVNQRYVAPVDGWYLAVHETFMATAAGTAPVVTGLYQPSVQGLNTWDSKQGQNFNLAGANPGGTSGVGLYYLRAGDWLRTGVLWDDTGAFTVNTTNAPGRRPHSEFVWISE